MSLEDLAELYGPAFDFPPRGAPPDMRYLLAVTPRCGGTLLAMALWRTGALGAPLEYLNLARLERFRRRIGGADLAGYLAALERRRTSPNGVFGLKAFLTQLLEARRQDPELLRRLAPRAWVRLRRRDRVAQAVSLARAEQTQAWVGAGAGRPEPVYSRATIEEKAAFLAWQDEGWDALLADIDSPVVSLWYEDLARDAVAAADDVLAALEMKAGPPVALPALVPQQDELSLDWIARYRAGD
jgi:LPS sulfotransferase NodH